MIDGRTHAEILSMTPTQRHRWYKTLSRGEREFVMVEIVAPAGRAKHSAAKMGENNPMYGMTGENNPFFGKTHSEEVRTKNRAAAVEQWNDPEFRAMRTGENHPMYGKTHTPEARAKMSVSSVKQWNDPKYRGKLSGENSPNFGKTGENHNFFGKTHTPEARAKMSVRMSGENNSNWQGGASFEPYCPAFNEERKEHIRNLCDRTCTVCGKSTLQNVSRNGWWLGRLTVDHLDENKLQGCDDWEWRLTALCASCHGRMQKQEIPHHLLLQLLLVNNRRHQTNCLFEEPMTLLSISHI